MNLRNFLSICAITALTATSVYAECESGISFGARNKYRTSGGVTLVDKSVGEVSADVACGPFDGFVWAIGTGAGVEEADVGVGYGGGNDTVSYRLGLETWQFPEDDEDSTILSLNGTLHAPMELSAEISQQLDGGTQYSGTVSRDIGQVSLSGQVNCLDNFFGDTACPSNYVVGASGTIPIQNINLELSLERHFGENGFEDDTVISVGLHYNF